MRNEKPSQPLPTENALGPRPGESEEQGSSAHTTSPTSQTNPVKRGSALRASLAIFAGRAAGAISRRFHIGGGTSIVGIVAQRVYPDIVPHLAADISRGAITVTGTNGKTTTSSFLADILRAEGLHVIHNKEGSNMMRGVATTLVKRAQMDGHMTSQENAITLLEVDEAALPEVVRVVKPRYAVFNNLFRDQLDRYGEVDSVVLKWEEMIAKMSASTTLILNADDPAIANLGRGFQGRVVYYGSNTDAFRNIDQTKGRGEHETLDTRVCPVCGTPYVYDVLFYSHMGHYHCPKCHQTDRPEPEIRLSNVEVLGFDRFRLEIQANNQTYSLVVPLPGLYNIYNALSAVATSLAQGISWEAIQSGIEAFQPAFGRGERIEAEGRTLRLMLAKNPTGLNEVLRTLFSDDEKKHVLMYLNDGIADGTDVSWIWDVDFERAIDKTASLTISGIRAFDLALRLKIAGEDAQAITIIPSVPFRQQNRQSLLGKVAGLLKRKKNADPSPDPAQGLATTYGSAQALDHAIKQTPVGETLYIVPTYTALLELRRELEDRGLTARYWEEKTQ